MNKIIIDGYNMIHGVPELRRWLNESLERSRQALIRILKSYLLNKKVEIALVFDGDGSAVGAEALEPARLLKIIFSRYPQKADPLVKKLIKKDERNKSLTIVTDDSDLILFAKAHQAEVLSTQAFYQRVAKRPQNNDFYHKFDREISEQELQDWLRIFGAK